LLQNCTVLPCDGLYAPPQTKQSPDWLSRPPGASSQSFLAGLPTSNNHAPSNILPVAVLVADKWFNGAWPESSPYRLKTSTLLSPFLLVTAEEEVDLAPGQAGRW
jgi:hypothetical protein